MERYGRDIPNRLRKYRRLAGFTQREVALILGVHDRSRIARWEQGICMPSGENLYHLSILYQTLQNELYMDYVKHISPLIWIKAREVKDDRNR